MSFNNKPGGFGDSASKNVNKDFSKKAEENINNLKEKGKQIAKENEGTIKTAKKTAIGCSIATFAAAFIVIAVIVFIIYKIFS